MNKRKNSFITNTFVVAILATLCCGLWGSATPMVKIGYELILPKRDVPSTLLFAGLRFLLAGIMTVVIYSVARKRFLKPRLKNVGKIATVSLFQTVIQYIFFYVGLANTTGVKGTVITGANSFFMILCASLIFHQEKLTLKKIVACAVGFLGIVLINIDGLNFNFNITGDLFVLFSSMAHGMSGALLKKYSNDEDPVVISGYQFMMGGFVMCIAGLVAGGVVSVGDIKALGVLLYLAMLSAVAYSLWGVLLKFNPVSKVSVYSFMIPVFGVFLSNLLLSEKSNVAPVNLIVALILITFGITLLNYKKETYNKE